ncbi:hypothetical protein F5Y17DRAFT_235828 [Xylariaceae sp. FL0594]|nr:hypothetical protein F5Y17DRAFT_235828 [Xylariaceae sp. FL0594]
MTCMHWRSLLPLVSCCISGPNLYLTTSTHSGLNKRHCVNKAIPITTRLPAFTLHNTTILGCCLDPPTTYLPAKTISSAMDERGDTSLQIALREFRQGQVAAYNHRQVWPPLDEPDGSGGPIPIRALGVSPEVYAHAFYKADLTNFEDELAEIRRQKIAGQLNPKRLQLSKGWYWTAAWWTMFLPATIFALHMFHFWLSPVFHRRHHHHHHHHHDEAKSSHHEVRQLSSLAVISSVN